MNGLEKLHLYKIKINSMEDNLRERHYISYVIVRWIPILLIIQSIFGNYTMSAEVDDKSLKSALMQLWAILIAVIWWEITYILLPTYRIASLIYGGVAGLFLKLVYSLVSLPIWVVSSYIIISAHELLIFDIRNLKEFLLGDQLTDCEWRSANEISEIKLDERNVKDDVSQISCRSNDGSYADNSKAKIIRKSSKVNRDLLSESNVNSSQPRRKISKRIEKEKRLNFENDDEKVRNDFHWSRIAKNTIKGKDSWISNCLQFNFNNM